MKGWDRKHTTTATCTCSSIKGYLFQFFLGYDPPWHSLPAFCLCTGFWGPCVWQRLILDAHRGQGEQICSSQPIHKCCRRWKLPTGVCCLQVGTNQAECLVAFTRPEAKTWKTVGAFPRTAEVVMGCTFHLLIHLFSFRVFLLSNCCGAGSDFAVLVWLVSARTCGYGFVSWSISCRNQLWALARLIGSCVRCVHEVTIRNSCLAGPNHRQGCSKGRALSHPCHRCRNYRLSICLFLSWK